MDGTGTQIGQINVWKMNTVQWSLSQYSGVRFKEYLTDKSYTKRHFCRALPNPSRSNFTSRSVSKISSIGL